jgi:hypothetical protein
MVYAEENLQMPNGIICRFANKFHQNRSRYVDSTGTVHTRTGYEGPEGQQLYSFLNLGAR